MVDSKENVLMRLRHSKELKQSMIEEADNRLSQLQALMKKKGVNSIYAL